MAQTTIQTENVNRTDRFLNAILQETKFLTEWEAMWAEMDIHQRLDLIADWKHLMVDYLPEVDMTYYSGKMTEEQTTTYRGLLAVLREKLPILERLGLETPPVFLVP